ncbi:hypothetical protein [Neobacillus sp. LXY-4]|uniref:hypothetical protein n=1 Tax=Neobacillus sp. LXY-4 TaxID=3379826 RepID=UPI003EE1781E
MDILFSLFFIGLVLLSSGIHAYFVWKKEDYKTLKVQVGIISLAILGGIFLIFNYNDASIASLLNGLSPLEE